MKGACSDRVKKGCVILPFFPGFHASNVNKDKTRHIQMYQSPSQIYVRRICNFLEVYASLVPYSPKEGAFILVAPSLETSCFPCRGPRVSTISFWISASMFWFFIRRSKTADLVWNLVYIILGHHSFRAQSYPFLDVSLQISPRKSPLLAEWCAH